uniref:Coiled-coil domain-containing protein 181 n=1 Tax=Macrostomum lignano TaxID=282301 RepID=A0A1I8HPL5_9PLAT
NIFQTAEPQQPPPSAGMPQTGESDDFGMRDDQRAAMAELERLQSTRPEDWNEEKDAEFLQLLMEPPPDYEVTRARIDELNAQLESEPLPEEEAQRRPTRIRFSENLVSVAPEPEPPAGELHGDTSEEEEDEEEDSEEEQQQQQQQQQESGDADGLGEMPQPAANQDDVDEAPPSRLPPTTTAEQQQQQQPQQEKEASQKVVVVNGGRIRFVDSSDFEAKDSPSPRPASRRPKSAAVSEFRRQPQAQQQPHGRKSSASASGGGGSKAEDNEAAFQAWLIRKQQQSEAEQRRAEAARRAETDRRRDAAAERDGVSFERWLEAKRAQLRREADLQQRRRRSEEDPPPEAIHSPEECRKAFRSWLKRKEEQRRQEEKLERQRARITRLALRRSRKSQALASALLAANSYRYMDYYGYR